jgi:hypothetical protein
VGHNNVKSEMVMIEDFENAKDFISFSEKKETAPAKSLNSSQQLQITNPSWDLFKVV